MSKLSRFQTLEPGRARPSRARRTRLGQRRPAAASAPSVHHRVTRERNDLQIVFPPPGPKSATLSTRGASLSLRVCECVCARAPHQMKKGDIPLHLVAAPAIASVSLPPSLSLSRRDLSRSCHRPFPCAAPTGNNYRPGRKRLDPPSGPAGARPALRRSVGGWAQAAQAGPRAGASRQRAHNTPTEILR